MSAIFDETSQKSLQAYNRGIVKDDDLFTLAKLTPQSMTPREKVRALEIMTASTAAANSDSQSSRASVAQTSSSTASSAPVENVSTESCRNLFNRQQTLMLLDLYSDRKQRFESPVHKKKVLWEEIANELNNRLGTAYNSGQVEGRWKTVVAAYKRHKKDQNTTGRDKKEFEFETQMDNLLGDRHDVVPMRILSTLPLRSEEDQSSNEPSTRAPPSTPSPSSSKGVKRKRNPSGAQGVLEFLKDYTDEQKKMKEEKRKEARQMHEEKMSMFKLMIDAMKK